MDPTELEALSSKVERQAAALVEKDAQIAALEAQVAGYVKRNRADSIELARVTALASGALRPLAQAIAALEAELDGIVLPATST